MPKKRKAGPLYVRCGNPVHGIGGLEIPVVNKVDSVGDDPSKVHYQSQVGPPHGKFFCAPCGHVTVRSMLPIQKP